MTQKNITIEDIAKKAKVSKSTVSRVLNNTTPVNEKKRTAVLKAMKKLNFKPNVFARSLAGGQSMTLGVITQYIGSPFYDSVTQGVIMGLTGTDYFPIFFDSQWKKELEEAAITTLIERQVDGLIMVGGDLEAETMDALRNDVPMVVVARKAAGWEQHSVTIDNVAAAKTATEYLINAGHRNIAHIMGRHQHPDAIDRYLGYQQALKEANLDVQPELFVEGDFSSQSGVLAMETLLMRGTSFSAVFSGNDEMAFGARLALYRRGIRVPDDMSIVGFDDQPASAFMTPPLTTVAQPAHEMGIAASKMLLNIISGNPVENTELPATLVVRESVARVR